jgi:hypothetical protein
MNDDVITKTPSLTRNVSLNKSSSSKGSSLFDFSSYKSATGSSATGSSATGSSATGSSATFDTNNDSSFWGIGTFFRYLFILIILAFLGFNVFSYLGIITESLSDFLKPLLNYFGLSIGETIHNTAKGSREVVDVSKNVLDSGINLLEKGLTGKQLMKKENKINKTEDKALEDALQQQKDNSIPSPDDSSSNTQMTSGKRKAGYCYIGEDRGFRSCIQVGEGDTCMSGDIFPSRDICVNPKLRE